MTAAKRYSLTDAFETVARSLREFGYPDVQRAMIRDVFDAMKRGDETMPHGIVGMFAQRQMEEVWADLLKLENGQHGKS